MDRTYVNILRWSLDHRWAAVAVALITFAATFPLNQMVGRDFVPADDQSELNVRIDMPEGMSLDGVKNIILDMAGKVEKMDGVAFVWPAIGSAGGKPNIYVRLVDPSKRRLTNLDMADKIRKEVLSLPQYS